MRKTFLGLVVTLCCWQLAWAQPPAPPMEEDFGPDAAAEGEDFAPPPPGGWEAGFDRPGPPPGGGPHRVFLRRTMGPVNDEQILHFLQQNLPERALQLSEQKAKDPEAYRRELRRLGLRTAPLRRLQSIDPAAFATALEEFKAEEKLHSLRQAYQAAGEGERAGLKSQMKPLLDQLFSARQARERKRLERLKQEVARQEARLSRRESSKQQIVNRRLEEITGDDALRW